MKAFLLMAALFGPAPALAAVECNTAPNAGDFRVRFSTEKNSVGVTYLHQDWIEKKTGRVSRKTSTVLYMSASAEKAYIRTVPFPREGTTEPSYLELSAANDGRELTGEVKRWSLRKKEGDYIPHWYQESIDYLHCLVD